MIPKQVRERYEKLKNSINEYRRAYHVYDTELIPESARDTLMKELAGIEEQYPSIIAPDSPTQRVAGTPLPGFKKVTHKVTQWSFNDAFSEEDIQQPLQQPVMQSVQQPAQSVQSVQQPVMMQLVASAGPSVATGFVAIAASTIFSAVLLMLIVKIMNIGSLIPLSNPWMFFIALPVISLLFSAVALSVTTRLLRVPGASFAKASVFVSIQTALVALVSLLVSFVSLPRITVFAATIVLWFVIFIGYYHASFLKTLATFLLNAVFTALIGIAIAIIVGMLGFGLISSLAGSLGGKLIEQAALQQPTYQSQGPEQAPIVF
jgi:hypothetical protein